MARVYTTAMTFQLYTGVVTSHKHPNRYIKLSIFPLMHDSLTPILTRDELLYIAKGLHFNHSNKNHYDKRNSLATRTTSKNDYKLLI
jgi:hypothetical protein